MREFNDMALIRQGIRRAETTGILAERYTNTCIGLATVSMLNGEACDADGIGLTRHAIRT